MTVRPPLSVFLLAALASGAAIAAEPTVEERQAAIERALPPAQILKGAPASFPSLAAEMQRLKVPGVSVAVIRNGDIAWAKGYGVVTAGGAPVTPSTLFQAASISKPVSAMGAMALVQAGKLDLDADANTYLQGWKLRGEKASDKATLRQLLSHTAGLGVHGFPGYAAGAPVPAVVQVLDGAKPANTKAVRIEKEPGSEWRYSGGGYTVIQHIMAQRSGKGFAELMADSVLGPAGMADSSFTQPATPPMLARAALPHGADGKPVKGGPHTYPELAAAGLWTTPSDLARFAIEVQRAAAGKGKVLKMDAAQRMLTPVKNGYALGFDIEGEGVARAFGHGGSNAGYQNSLFAYSGNGDGAVVMTNSDAGGGLARDVIRAIAAEYKWPSYRSVERSFVEVDAKAIKALTGTYNVKQLGDFKIGSEGGKLTLWLRPGQGQTLYAQSPTVYFVLDQELELRFDQAGNYKSGRVVSGAFDVKFNRVP